MESEKVKKVKLGKMYHASDAYRVINKEFNHFSDYLAHCKKNIESYRLDLDSPLKEKIILTNCPFELVPDQNTLQMPLRKGIVLFHGLYDSPSNMRSLAEYFVSEGFTVRVMLLPGHGTVPGDLLHVTYHDWLTWARFGMNALSNEVDELYLGGFSLGGALATYLALCEPQRIRGLFLFAPALVLTHALTNFAKFHKQLAWLLPDPHWLSLMEEWDYAKYQSFTVNSLCQMYGLDFEIKMIMQDKKLTVPSFWGVVQSDEVLNSRRLVEIFIEKTTEKSELIYYSPKEKSFSDTRIEWRSSQRQSEHIIDFSHLSIPVSPSHFHYGSDGDFQTSLKKKYITEENQKKIILEYGSLKNTNLFIKSSLIRLTYNPDFVAMTKKMSEFLKGI